MNPKTDNQTRRAKLSPAKQTLLKKRLASLKSSANLISKRPDLATYPLSFAQERFWFLAELTSDTPVYNRPLRLRLTGRLNPKALEQALGEMVRRHEGLRATFSLVDGVLLQQIKPAQPLSLPIVAVNGVSVNKRSQEAHRIAVLEAERPFDLTQTLFRAILLRVEPESHVLIMVIHHIAFDAWSAQNFIEELATLYDAATQNHSIRLSDVLPELPIQVADFAHWQRQRWQGAQLEKSLAYWQEKLAGVEPLNLPTDHPRPARQTYQAGQQSLFLTKEFVDRIQTLSQQEEVTLFMTLLAAFQVLLYRYTAQNDIAIGTPIAGRTHVETERLIGCFLNLLVLRINVSGTLTFRQLLVNVQQITLDAMLHQEMPFEQLVAQLQTERDISHSPLAQVMFNFKNMQSQQVNHRSSGLSVDELAFDNMATQFDLTLEIVAKNDGLACLFIYSCDLFEDATIQRMVGHFQTLLNSIVENPSQLISNLPILTEAEEHQLLVEWNDTEVESTKNLCIHQLFEAQALQTPNAAALLFEDEQMSYQELDERANQLAHYLIQLGVGNRLGKETKVGIYAERSIKIIVSVLGILKAGGIYVPLDPSYPQERIEFMLEDAEISVLLTDQPLEQHLSHSSLSKIEKCVRLDRDWTQIAEQRCHASTADVQPGNVMCILYTSGSTGRPKGVLNSHRGMANRVACTKAQFPLTSEDRILQKTSLSFDFSIWELFWPLVSGAILVLTHPNGRKDPAYLIETIRKKRVTTVYFNASMLQLFMTANHAVQCTSLKHIFCGGEALSLDLMHSTLSQLDVELHNLYGPTEASIYVSDWRCLRNYERALVSIGRPVSNVQLYIVDTHLQPVPIGIVGELLIGGIQVADGYYKRPELTAEKFILNHLGSGEQKSGKLYKTGDLARWLPDGTIEFVGRIDYQVKIRGFRVELGEIETALNSHPEVENSVVMVRDKTLVAYVVSPATSSRLHTYLASKLPDYMIPSIFIQLKALPLNSNNKLDRASLPEPDMSRPMLDNKFIAPETSIEKTVADIWTELLNLEQVGIYDNFFELGGHSMALVHMLAQIEQEFGLRLPLANFFPQPTIAHLAHLLSDKKFKTPLLTYNGLSHIQQKVLEKLHKQLFEPEELQAKSTPTFFKKWHQRRTWNNWHRRRIAISVSAGVLPYPIRCKLLVTLFRSHRLRRLLFAREVEWTRQFLDTIDGQFHDEKMMINCLLYSCLDYYKFNLSKAEIPFDSPLIEGSELIRAAHSNGKGIILIQSHGNVNIPIDLSAITPSFRVAGIANYLRNFGIQDNIIESEIFSYQLDRAYKVLQEGGLVQIAGDGQQGHSVGVEFNFHGRRRMFFCGFAELALMTGAAVIAVDREIDTQNEVRFKFVGPLDMGDETMSRREQVSYIVSQYVDICDRIWREMPWIVPWYQMAQHLDCPPIRESQRDERREI